MSGVWTNNGKALRNAFLCGDFITGLSALKDRNGNFGVTLDTENLNNHDSTTGIIRSLMCPVSTAEYTSSAHLRCEVGAGDTIPTVMDYELASRFTNEINYLSVVNEKPVWNVATGAVENTIKLTMQNRAAEAVVVKEWGIFIANLSRWHLIYRATLDSPVTLQPNQSAMLTLTRSVTLTDPVVWE